MIIGSDSVQLNHSFILHSPVTRHCGAWQGIPTSSSYTRCHHLLISAVSSTDGLNFLQVMICFWWQCWYDWYDLTLNTRHHSRSILMVLESFCWSVAVTRFPTAYPLWILQPRAAQSCTHVLSCYQASKLPRPSLAPLKHIRFWSPVSAMSILWCRTKKCDVRCLSSNIIAIFLDLFGIGSGRAHLDFDGFRVGRRRLPLTLKPDEKGDIYDLYAHICT